MAAADSRTPQRSALAFAFAVPIAILGGLIGLGGAEFRLPVLAGPLRYSAKQAVPLNLAVSLITVVASLLIRANTLPLGSLSPLIVPMLALIGGAVFAAFFGATLGSHLSERRLEQTILALLLAIGTALIVEAFLPQQGPGFIPPEVIWQLAAGIVFGLAIGLVSSLLGVAGGELIIPTLIFAFGADVKVAGTASLFISLPTILVGVGRYARRGAFADRAPLRETVAPMGAGSVIGALIGGLLVGFVPSSVLKFVLGIILIVSALRIFRKTQAHQTSTA
ncbi:MAG: sulfite exporter TauE/SafE family protein [Anaerolineae bacterium]|nr:sulfite exporter TauE/SafE family protein [Anaerolineae bacterium]MDW8173386.1 sulfite exporter TauE/SafE family protein [Anaerolineae bacterium]